MQKDVSFTIAQLNPTIGNIEENATLVTDVITQHSDTDIFIFPECMLTGYMPLDHLYYDTFFSRIKKSLESIQLAMHDTQRCIIGTPYMGRYGNTEMKQHKNANDDRLYSITSNKENYSSQFYPYIQDNLIYNTALYCHEFGILGMQQKRLLPQNDVFYEPRYFQEGDVSRLFFYNDISFVMLICEDLWGPIAPGYPAYDVLQLKPDIIIVISASPYELGKKDKRILLTERLALKNKSPLIFCNMVGTHDEIIFDGSSFIVTAEGEILTKMAHCKQDMVTVYFSCCQERNISVEKNTKGLSTNISEENAMTMLKEDIYAKQHVTQDTHVSSLHKNVFTQVPPFSEHVPELVEVLSFGLNEYLEKTSLPRKVHIGISGGIDSAVVAALACYSVGPDNVCGIILPSKYTSGESMEDAIALINSLHISHHILSIKKLHSSTLKTLAPVFCNTTADTSEENVQARLRAVLLMGYANKHASTLLTTGNKSELAVGYATLYGDMCGALNMIGDLYKTQVYEVADYINRDEAIIPKRIVTKPPSAELRKQQRDDDSLPPYDILDSILYLFINEYKSLEYVLSLKKYEKHIVQQIWNLYQASEFKRYQAPPILKVSSRAFGRGRLVPLVARF